MQGKGDMTISTNEWIHNTKDRSTIINVKKPTTPYFYILDTSVIKSSVHYKHSVGRSYYISMKIVDEQIKDKPTQNSVVYVKSKCHTNNISSYL